MIFLIVGIPTVFASYYRHYGDNYGYSYSGLNQNPVFVKNAYGSRYPESHSQIQYLVKNAYGSHYGESYSQLVQPYYYEYGVRHNKYYRKYSLGLSNLDVQAGLSQVGYIDETEGLVRYQENWYHPRYIG